MEGVAWQDVLSWCTAHQLLATCLSLVGCAVLSVVYRRFATMWALRKVPNLSGIWGYLPILGDLPVAAKMDATWLIEAGVHSRKFPKACTLWLGAYPHVILTDVELSRRLLAKLNRRASHEKLVMRKPLHGKIFYSSPVFLNGEKYRAQRKAAETVVLHSQAMAAQVPFVAECTRRLAKYLDRFAASGEPVDVQEAIWMMAGDAVCGAAFGVDMHATNSSICGDDVEEGWWEHPVGSPEFGRGMINTLRRLFKEDDMQHATAYTPLCIMFPELRPFLIHMASVLPDKAFAAACKNHNGAHAGIRKMIAQWKAQQQVDGDNGAQPVSATGLLAKVLSNPGEKSILDEDEIVGLALGTVLAGYETTGTTAAMALYYMAVTPETQAKAKQEVDEVLHGQEPTMEDLERLPYITAVINEALRLAAPGSVATREIVNESLDIGDGIVLPKGAFLIMPTLAFMRDPAIWPRATEFLPDRHIQPGNEHLAPSNPNAFMPFGHGSRFCLGYKFATMEARMAIARLLQRFECETVPGTPPPKARTSITLKPDKVVLRVKHRAAAK